MGDAFAPCPCASPAWLKGNGNDCYTGYGECGLVIGFLPLEVKLSLYSLDIDEHCCFGLEDLVLLPYCFNSRQEKQNDVHWMLQCIISSVQRTATRGPLFEFTPEFYMDAAINAFHGLRHYFHPTTNFNDIPGTYSLGLYFIVVSDAAVISGRHATFP